MEKIIKLSIIFLVLGSILISGCIDSEKPSEIGGPTKSVQSDVPREWIEMGSYDYVGKPADIGGRLVFYAEKNDGKFIVDDGAEESTKYSFEGKTLVDVGGKLASVLGGKTIVYGGDVVDHPYRSVAHPISVGGKLAYFARNVDLEQVVVFDGKEFGIGNSPSDPVGIGDKLAYKVYDESDRTESVILDGKKVSIQGKTEFDDLGDLMDVDGKLAFNAVLKRSGVLYYDGEAIPGASYPASIGGKLAYVAEKGDRLIIVYDGNEIGTQYDTIWYSGNSLKPIVIVNVDNKLTYIAKKGEKEFIVFDGGEIGTQYDMAGYPTNIGGKLAYAAKIDGNEFIVYDGIEVGNQYDKVLDFINVGGKLAYKAKKDGKYFIVMEK